MSIKDPLLKELKGYVSKLIIDCPKPITDEENYLLQFCECFEKILYKGLLPHYTVISVIRSSDCWYWLEKLGAERWGIPYSFSSSVDEVRNCQRVTTAKGRVRLLIRHCLNKKCLHVPLEFIVREGRCCLLYSSDSVLGDSNLASVLISILCCLSHSTSFSLVSYNAMFLDSTWELPMLTNISFVPTNTIGLSIIFVKGRAVICKVLNDSVAAENGTIMVGDVLDSVNGMVINGKAQGSLSCLLKKSAKLPINISIIKATRNGHLYDAIVPLLRQAGLDPALVHAREHIKESSQCDESDILFLGTVNTGERGDVKQIQVAINNLKNKQSIPVTIECHHLGLRVISNETNQLIDEHNYMEISSCGSSSTSLIYFGYIAGNINYTECKSFVCYLFSSRKKIQVDSLLKTIEP